MKNPGQSAGQAQAPLAADLSCQAQDLLGNHKGECPVYLVAPNGAARIEVGRELFVTPDCKLFEEIRNIFGENCLSVNNAP